MKKYQWNDDEKIHAHCFSDDGVYIGFMPHGEELQPEYSIMVKDWVEREKTEQDLEVAMKNMGFIPTKTDKQTEV